MCKTAFASLILARSVQYIEKIEIEACRWPEYCNRKRIDRALYRIKLQQQTAEPRMEFVRLVR